MSRLPVLEPKTVKRSLDCFGFCGGALDIVSLLLKDEIEVDPGLRRDAENDKQTPP
jgi:hypothetical protein